jgi:hypothetical protein
VVAGSPWPLAYEPVIFPAAVSIHPPPLPSPYDGGCLLSARSPSILTATSRSFTSGCSRSSARVHSGRSVPSSLPTTRPHPPWRQVRMVQHKQTRATYALKYINKLKAVRMKAVGNIIQERRLLEKVGLTPSTPSDRINSCFGRLTTHSSSTFGTRSKTMKTASSSSTSCLVVTFVVRRVFDPGPQTYLPSLLLDHVCSPSAARLHFQRRNGPFLHG